MIGRSTSLLACALLTGSLVAPIATFAMPQLDSVEPAAQRVYERVVLRGQGFGNYDPGVSEVLFVAAGGGGNVVAAGVPHVWRDDFISVRVPVGDGDGPVAKGAVDVQVITGDGSSGTAPLEIIFVSGASLDFIEKSDIVNDLDISGYLGAETSNMARTKDAEFGDINGDGFIDVIDNNSNNQSNGTHEVARLNREGMFFSPVSWEPLNQSDTGNFLVFVPPNGNYVADAVVYDADLIDLNNDGLPDWVQAASGSNIDVRVAINNFQGRPGRFLEATNAWLPNPNFPSGSPDDVGHVDVNFDGFLDVGVAFRFSNRGQVYVNQNGQTFGTTIDVISSAGSMHDIFFLDANADGFPDIVMVNESGNAPLLLHNGNVNNPAWAQSTTLSITGFAGLAADLNGDGLDDVAIVGSNQASVFINNPASPGSFVERSLSGTVQFMYDVEAGDIDLDGDIDLASAAVVTSANNSARIYENDGNGFFTNLTNPGADVILPGIASYQRLSVDLFDVDNDHDLDLYLTGADGIGVFGFGAVANQFWESRILGFSIDPQGSCPGAATLTGKGATPNGVVGVLQGTAPGLRVFAAGPCAGTTFAVQNLSVLGITIADADGEFQVPINLAGGDCNTTIQAIDATSCAVTSVDSLPD